MPVVRVPMATDGARLEMIKLLMNLPDAKVQEALVFLRSLRSTDVVVYDMADTDEANIDERLCADYPLDASFGDSRMYKWDPCYWRYKCLLCGKCVDSKHRDSKQHKDRAEKPWDYIEWPPAPDPFAYRPRGSGASCAAAPSPGDSFQVTSAGSGEQECEEVQAEYRRAYGLKPVPWPRHPAVVSEDVGDAPKELPPNWRAQWSPQHCRYYYWLPSVNGEPGLCVWEKPSA